MAVDWKYCRPATVPGTYFTSISTSSPCLSAVVRYWYRPRCTRYVRTTPARFKMAPIVRAGMYTPFFAKRQCSFSAHCFVSFLSSMTRSLSRMGFHFGDSSVRSIWALSPLLRISCTRPPSVRGFVCHVETPSPHLGASLLSLRWAPPTAAALL